jgi:SAM-dependent methyltransferase
VQTEEYDRLFRYEDQYWWFVGRRRLALSLLDRALKPGEDKRILDLGCGTGAVLSELARRGRALGLDTSPLALSYCHKRGLDRLVLGDAADIPLASGTLDAVVALDILEHVDDDAAAFAECARALRPGGHLVLSVPAFRWLWGPHDVALMHRRRYTLRQVRARLEGAGLVPLRISHSVFFLFGAVVAVRLVDKLRTGPAKVSLPAVPKPVNGALIGLQGLETSLIRALRLPIGSSVVALARKPD